MKKCRKNLQELNSQAFGAVKGGMDLSGQRRSNNFQEHVRVGNTVYVYDDMGLIVRSYPAPN